MAYVGRCRGCVLHCPLRACMLLRLLRLLRRWMSLAARRVLCVAALVSVVRVSDCV
eukprot:COSAG06_NODE_68022_length_243_cov_5.458333_1_plen_55_part_01